MELQSSPFESYRFQSLHTTGGISLRFSAAAHPDGIGWTLLRVAGPGDAAFAKLSRAVGLHVGPKQMQLCVDTSFVAPCVLQHYYNAMNI